jgi:hypothetical protein
LVRQGLDTYERPEDADPVNVVVARIVDRGIFLRGKDDGNFTLSGRVNRLSREPTPDKDGMYDVRKRDQFLKRQKREDIRGRRGF